MISAVPVSVDETSERPAFDVGIILRDYADRYLANRPISEQKLKAYRALSECRTSVLGGHMEECDGCGALRPVYNSCGNRHCPKCQGISTRKWLRQRCGEMLPVSYFHTIFTMPHAFNVLLPANNHEIYSLIFEASSEAVLKLSRQRYGGVPAMVGVLHTWGQQLGRHIHVHYIITGGVLTDDHQRWVQSGEDFLLDSVRLSDEYRKSFCRKLRLRFRKGKLLLNDDLALPDHFDALVAEHEWKRSDPGNRDREGWVTYIKKPVRGEVKVLDYMARYTHRIGLSNRRILDVNDDGVTIDYKDYRDLDESGCPKHKARHFTIESFIDHFLMHVLPRGFRKIRFYGVLGGPNRHAKLERCRELLAVDAELVGILYAAIHVSTFNHCPVCRTGRMHAVLDLPSTRAPPLGFEHGECFHVA